MVVGATAVSVACGLLGYRAPPLRVAKIGGYLEGGLSLILLAPTFGMHQIPAGAAVALAAIAFFAGAAGFRRPRAYLVGATATGLAILLLVLAIRERVDPSFALLGVLLPAVLLALLARRIETEGAARPPRASETS